MGAIYLFIGPTIHARVTYTRYYNFDYIYCVSHACMAFRNSKQINRTHLFRAVFK